VRCSLARCIEYCMRGLHFGGSRKSTLWVLHTRVGVPFIVVMGSVLLALELLVHDFFELDHFGGVESVRLGDLKG
jgi:hypothetical protein